MEFKERTLLQLADLICGNLKAEESFFSYRSSSKISQFFRDAETDYLHDGSTRNRWIAETLKSILAEPSQVTGQPSDTFMRIIQLLMEQEEATGEQAERPKALEMLNKCLSREGLEAFYAEDKKCYLRNTATKAVLSFINPHRSFSANELLKKDLLIAYLNMISEDNLIEEILLPLFRQIGFHRITSAGHKDKALEYGKDIWMKYILPTQNVLYFGAQVKKGKLDSAGLSKTGNINVAEIYQQALMMLGHEIFDPETNRKVLVDHAFIIAGGEITKQARNWIGAKLDTLKRSQLLFLERDDIINLFIASNMPLPPGALPPPKPFDSNDLPF